jgi:hypothetical protein
MAQTGTEKKKKNDSQNTISEIISLNTINELVFIKETRYIFFKVDLDFWILFRCACVSQLLNFPDLEGSHLFHVPSR